MLTGGESMASEKLDELSSGLDDLTVTVDELKEEPGNMDRKKLDVIHEAIETASDAVDELEDPEEGDSDRIEPEPSGKP
jgi:outer membrane murein-binding lipoprotein Lpp